MEEVKFKNTSRMDAGEIAVFQNYAMKKMIWGMSIAFALIMVGLGVGLWFWDMTAGIICVVCGLVGGFWLLPYLMKKNQESQVLKTLGDRKYLNTFSFFEEYLDVVSEATANATDKEYKEVGTQRVYYKDLHKIVTYKDRMFVFLNESQSFILNFKGMTVGTVKELLDFMALHNVKIVDKSKSVDKKEETKRK